MKFIFLGLSLFSTFYFVQAQTVQKEAFYKKGVVVSAYPEASKIGIEILKKGGNAVDAAVAVQFALAVVYPTAGNIGGGGFMVYRSAAGESNTLDYREKAPLKASRDMYLDENGNAVKDKSLLGQLAAGIPGTVDGMVEAHKRYGKLSWKKLVQPAVDLAKQGFRISAKQATDLNSYKASFEKFNPQGTAFVKAAAWKKDDLLLQPELAHTLELIRDKGRAGFYEDEVAEYLVNTINNGSGLISKKDLSDYHSVWRQAVTGNYKDYKIITMPPPSSGGIALIQLLESIEPFPLKRWGHNRDSTVQFIVEAERRVYADRATHLGDPDFYKVPQSQLLKPAYQHFRMKDFNWAHATPSDSIAAGKPGKESEETTHFSIVDEKGNAVSITTTLNGAYGSRVVINKAGFLLNNEMDDFSVKPGSPNMHGLVGGEANAIAPGKRMLSSMTPTILEKKGKLFMVVGTPGGSTIITSVFQTIINVLEFGQPVQQAVTSLRFHHQWLPDEVDVEQGALDSLTTATLMQKGYKFIPRSSIGRVDAIVVTKEGYQGGADPRGDDTSVGW